MSNIESVVASPSNFVRYAVKIEDERGFNTGANSPPLEPRLDRDSKLSKHSQKLKQANEELTKSLQTQKKVLNHLGIPEKKSPKVQAMK